MKAITVTTQLKQYNTELFSGIAAGSIKTFGTIPRSFYSLNYNLGRRTDGYHTLGSEFPTLFEADGFYDVTTPAIDEATQKLGDIYFNVDHFTYPIIAKTQEELDEYQQELTDNDTASTNNNSRKDDGVVLFDRVMSEIERRYIDGEITGNEAETLESTLYTLIDPLYKGLWRLVKSNLNGTTPPANPTYLEVFNWVKNKVDTYVVDNY